MNGRRPGRASASAPPPPSALHPQRLRPSSTWRAVRVACLRPWSLWSRPSISPRSQARDQRRATSTRVPPQRQGGGAALPRGAIPVLHRLARSVRGRKPGGRFQVMPTCGNLDRVPRTLGSVHRAWRALPRPLRGTRVRIEFTAEQTCFGAVPAPENRPLPRRARCVAVA